jgi:hypothetical protein
MNIDFEPVDLGLGLLGDDDMMMGDPQQEEMAPMGRSSAAGWGRPSSSIGAGLAGLGDVGM